MDLGLPLRDRLIIEGMESNHSLNLYALSLRLRKNIIDIDTRHFLYLAYLYGRNRPDLERMENNKQLTIKIYAN